MLGVLACFACLRAHVLCVFTCLRTCVLGVLTCFVCLHACGPCVLACLSASVLGALACVRACDDEIFYFLTCYCT